MPAESRENPLLKKGNSDAFLYTVDHEYRASFLAP